MSDLPDPLPGDEEIDLEGEETEVDAEVDAGGEDAEGDAGNDGQGQEEEGDVAPEPRRGRKTEAQRWRERSERNERELQALKNQFQGFSQASQQFRQQPDPGVARQQAEQRRAQLEMMSPLEQTEFVANEKMQQIQQAFLFERLQNEDRLDKRDYDLAARTDRTRAQYRDRVEAALAAERQAGNLRATRDGEFYKLYGHDVAERAARAAPGQRRRAAANVARQQTRPGGARGDGAAGGRRPAAGTAEDDDRIIEEGFRNGMRL